MGLHIPQVIGVAAAVRHHPGCKHVACERTGVWAGLVSSQRCCVYFKYFRFWNDQDNPLKTQDAQFIVRRCPLWRKFRDITATMLDVLVTIKTAPGNRKRELLWPYSKQYIYSKGRKTLTTQALLCSFR